MTLPKISLFLQDLYGGGAERVMLHLAGGIAARGYPVDLILIKHEGAYLDQIPNGVNLIVLGTGRTLRSVPALARYLRMARPVALLTALVHVNVGALLAAAMARRETRIIVTEHSQISRNFAGTKSGSIKWAYRAVPHAYPWAHRIVAVSGSVADDLAKFSGIDRDRITVIHNGIVTPELYAKAAEAADHPWFDPGEPPVIISAGRLVEVKDFQTLIRAFAKMRLHERLVILGEGDQRQDLERLVRELGIADHVSLPGFCPNPYALISQASLFVQSSRWEGLPTVLVEAMACGTPIVATDCPGGSREIMGNLGTLVPVGNPIALANAMILALNQPVADLKRRAQDFTLERAVSRYLELAVG